MRKIGNKGFMMAEVVIVSCIILVSLVGLYATFNKLYIVYTERSYYYNVDCVYALKNLYDKLIDNNEFVDLVNEQLNDADYVEVSSSYYNYIKTTYGINKIYLFKYDKDSVSSFNANVNSSFSDYIKYLANSLDYDEDFSYMFVIEIQDGDYLYYGNYRVR